LPFQREFARTGCFQGRVKRPPLAYELVELECQSAIAILAHQFASERQHFAKSFLAMRLLCRGELGKPRHDLG